jgi:hypothetical protein
MEVKRHTQLSRAIDLALWWLERGRSKIFIPSVLAYAIMRKWPDHAGAMLPKKRSINLSSVILPTGCKLSWGGSGYRLICYHYSQEDGKTLLRELQKTIPQYRIAD